MKILIACHCKSPAVTIFRGRRITSSKSLTFYSERINPSDVEISYMDKDPNCPDYGQPLQYGEWDEIPDGYFDYIWFHFCPIWIDESHAIDILGPALRVLKPTGKLLVAKEPGGHTTLFKEDFLKDIVEKVDPKVTLTIKAVSELPFRMIDETATYHTHFYVIEKHPVAGGRRKTRRRKTKTSHKRMKQRKLTH